MLPIGAPPIEPIPIPVLELPAKPEAVLPRPLDG